MTDAPKAERDDIWGAVKWVCIVIVVGLIGFGCWKIYQTVTAPARAVEETKTAVAEKVAAVTSRLDIPVNQQSTLNQTASAAFDILEALPQTAPQTASERLTRASHLRGSDNRVCAVNLDFGAGETTTYVAADNDGYATAKSMGGLQDRLIRMAVATPNDTLGLRVLWEPDIEGWRLRWKRTTVRKAVADTVAEARILDVLRAVPEQCGAGN